QLRSSTAIATTLSGGLDSGLVTTGAARELERRGERITAYTSVPAKGFVPSQRPGGEADDGAYAREVAGSAPNIDHVLVSPDGFCTLDVIPAIHEQSCTPTKSVTNLLWLDPISRRVADRGERVLLMGQTGNATISFSGAGALHELAILGR